MVQVDCPETGASRCCPASEVCAWGAWPEPSCSAHTGPRSHSLHPGVFRIPGTK